MSHIAKEVSSAISHEASPTDSECPYCDLPGSEKTYRNQVCMPLNGTVRCIDRCIHQIVAALNAGGVRTFASCCGHKLVPGEIDLEDGRKIVVLEDGSPTSANPYRVTSVNTAPVCEP